ncbi:LOW QUALITY PROTEIN: hypothetical protein CVT25_006134 [Psilocybe cyanescens]|uniref:Uncharacterized protein n=1 Tax=Psilocybe cyanescens TaxID=93625 RepID=A0A409WYZ8_PSICY|nr:LOW QUALITY PROTEIN: hypothetical protein CVT25_006134 [Psilocybe cyanescens]
MCEAYTATKSICLIKIFGDLNSKDILSLSRTIGGWAHGHASSTIFFWGTNIDRTVHDLSIHRYEVRDLKPADAQENLGRFKADRTRLVDNILSDASRCNQWLERNVRDRQKHTYDFITKRQTAWTAEFAKKADLTDRIWISIQSIPEPMLMEVKTKRLARDFTALKATRRQLFQLLTASINEGYSRRSGFPSLEHMISFLHSRRLSTFPSIPTLYLYFNLPICHPESDIEPGKILSIGPPLDPLDKATICCSACLALAYYGIMLKIRVVYSPKRSSVPESLVPLPGLNATTGTAYNMDLNLRCVAYPDEPGKWLRFAYSWRAAPFTWDVLTSYDTLCVKQDEPAADAKQAYSTWTCNHCAAYMDNLQTYSEVC